MNVLVTGGAGYIGRHLVNALLAEGHMVRVLDLQAPDAPQSPGGCEFIQGSLADSSLVAKVVQGIQAVHHLAWSFQPGDERREIEENLQGTLNLLEASRASGVEHFIFASSAVVYGPTGPEPVHEEHVPHPEQGTIGGPSYGITKLACEKYSQSYQRRGLPVTVLRIHGVFSQRRLGQFEEMIRRARNRQAVRVVRGAGGQYVHLEDVVAACCLVTGNRKAFGEVFNLAGSWQYQDTELARQIADMAETGAKVELVEDPGQRMVSVSAEKLRRVLGFSSMRGEFLSGLVRFREEEVRYARL